MSSQIHLLSAVALDYLQIYGGLGGGKGRGRLVSGGGVLRRSCRRRLKRLEVDDEMLYRWESSLTRQGS